VMASKKTGYPIPVGAMKHKNKRANIPIKEFFNSLTQLKTDI